MTKTKKVILEQQAINRKLWAKENGRMHHVDANKLIAEFMGANPFRESVNEDVLSYEMYGLVENIEDGLNEKHFFLPSEMKYNTSWDWLMPVVEKIENFGYEFIIAESRCYVKHNTDHSIKELFHIETIGSKIDTTYKAVVEFIQTQTKDKDKEEALKYLSDKGYAVGSLWHIDDIQQGIECDDDTALKILNESLESDNVCEAVYETIDYIAINEYKLKIKE